MAVKKQRSNTHAHLEKIFTLAGLALVLVGCLANLYSAHLNWQFLHEPLDFIYYLRHIILLGGGFVASYFLAGKSTRHDQLFLGVIHGERYCSWACLYWLL